MTETHSPDGTELTERDQIQHDIERTRDHLGETVDLLGEKFDVKKQASRHRTQLVIIGSAVAGAVVVIACWRRFRS